MGHRASPPKRSRSPRAVAAWIGPRSSEAALFDTYNVDTLLPLVRKLKEIDAAVPLLHNLFPKGRSKRERAAITSWIISDPRFQWEKVEAAIGLAEPNPWFRARVADALSGCLLLQLLDGGFKQLKQLRERWLKIAAHGEASLAAVARLSAELATLPGSRDRAPPLISISEELEAWTKMARSRAAALRGAPQGRPTRYHVVARLVRKLANIFERATGHEAKVHWNPIKNAYDGSFLGLVEAVLPRLSVILGQIGCRLPEPNSPEARGQFIVRSLRKDKKAAAES